MPSPSTLPEELLANPELLASFLAAQELERKKIEWANWANSEYQKCKNARSNYERQWYINLAFVAGKQYVAPIMVPTAGFRLMTPKSPPWRVQLVVNKTRTAVRKEHAKLTKSKPIPTVRPATNEDEDWSAAAVGEQLVKSEFATAYFEKQYRSWIWWGVVCGTSFIKQWYDPTELDFQSMSIPPMPTMPDGSPVPEEILQLVPEVQEKLNTPVPAVGRIIRERVSPFHIFVPDLLCEDMNDQPYVIHLMTKSPLWVKEKFGIDAQPDCRASSTVLDAATIIAKGAEQHLDSIMVKEFWIQPRGHKDFPQGGMLTVINDKVVQATPKWPYPFPEYPFYKYDGIPTGGFYSDSTVVDLIPIQKEYNKKRSQAIEIQNMVGKPKLLYAKGSVNPKMISSEPGQSIPYVPGYDPPIPLPGQEVPVSFVNEIQQLQQEFDDISSQHEVSRGDTPNAQVSSGTAIAYLQEQDDAALTSQVSSIENACELLGKHYLSMVGTYWNEDRIIRTTGKNNSFEALHWKQGMLKGNTDVKIQTGSALPFSKAATQALLTEMMQNGFIDPQAGLEMMDFGNVSTILDDQLIDKRQAMRENLKMAAMPEKLTELIMTPAPGPNGEPPVEDPATGQKFNGDGTPFQPQPPVPVNSWDAHDQHVMWHNHFRKSQEFELLPESVKQAFELHVQLHQVALQASMVNQQGMVLQEPEGGGQYADEEMDDGTTVPTSNLKQEPDQSSSPDSGQSRGT